MPKHKINHELWLLWQSRQYSHHRVHIATLVYSLPSELFLWISLTSFSICRSKKRSVLYYCVLILTCSSLNEDPEPPEGFNAGQQTNFFQLPKILIYLWMFSLSSLRITGAGNGFSWWYRCPEINQQNLRNEKWNFPVYWRKVKWRHLVVKTVRCIRVHTLDQ